MAYISHSQYRAYMHSHRLGWATPELLTRSALVAVAAAAVIVGLSDVASVAERAASGKGDRVAMVTAPVEASSAAVMTTAASGGVEIMKDAQGRVVYVNDPGARTTTVARGASAPLTPESPFGAAAK